MHTSFENLNENSTNFVPFDADLCERVQNDPKHDNVKTNRTLIITKVESYLDMIYYLRS